MRRALLLAALLAVLAPAGAVADHRETVLASPGSGAAFFGGGSPDGKHVYFVTTEQLADEDTDSGADLYDRHDGTTELVSAPEDGAPGGSGGGTFAAASPDGGRVYFRTRDGLVADDDDGLEDVYLREGGHTTLVSRGSGQFNFLGLYFWCGSTTDADHVWFRTTKALAADDTDFAFDVYEYDATTDELRMESVKSSGSNGSSDADCGGHSADGQQTFFSTRDRMTSDDTDSVEDVYRHTASGTELITPGTVEGVRALSTSDDGEHVIFESTEQLDADDEDAQKDVYERTGGAYVLVSQGPNSFNGDFRSDFQRASADGTRIFFTTSDHPVASDTDDTDDIFVRMNGTTRIVSHGPAGGDAGIPIVVERANRAGTRLYFRTGESLTADDHDFSSDSYVWEDGTLSRVSVAAAHDDDIGYDAGLAGATEDGRRVFFTSLQSMDDADTDTIPSVAPDGYDDIYEYAFGQSNFLSTGPNPDPGPSVDAFFRGFSDDGEKVWFDTTERLTADDTDELGDVYESRVNHSPVVEAAPSGSVRRYRDGSPGVAVDPDLAVADPDTAVLTGATVRLSGGAQAGDALDFDPGSGVTGSFAGDTLALAGAASPADYQAVLRSVRFATDGSGRLGARTVSFSVTDGIDTSAAASRGLEVVPGLNVPHFTEAPAALSSAASPRFAFAGDDGAQFECSVDDAGFSACTSPIVVGPLADGPHAVRVRARDGGALSAATRHEWTVDTTPPGAPLLLAPDAQTTRRDAELAFGGEAVATFECSRDGDAFAPCASPARLSDLALGPHSFAVRQTDAAGNTGPAASAAWEVVTASTPRDERPPASLNLSAELGSPLVVGAHGLPVGCRLAGAFLRRCDVVLVGGGDRAPRAAGEVKLGGGRAVMTEEGHHRALVHAQLSRTGIAHVRRRGRRGERVHVRVTARSFDGRSATTSATGRLVLPGRYGVPANGGYGTNVAALSRGRRAQLVAVARQLTGVGVARCEGHADGSATPRHARRLALRRASAVCAFLRAHGVAAELSVRSYGGTRPRAGNATAQGRALNRRVEVVVVR